MYNDREKLLHHLQLLSEKEAAADLELLKRLRPNHPRLEEFGFSPKRSAGDILLELLSVAHRDDIVKNRLQVRMSAEPKTEHKTEDTDQKPEDTDQKPEDAPSDSGTEDHPEDTTEGLKAENQELQDQLDEKEDEISDLQDQLDEKDEISDLQDQLDEKDEQISDLEEQLAEEKKSETPVKAPAKKTAAKKATAKKSGSKKK